MQTSSNATKKELWLPKQNCKDKIVSLFASGNSHPAWEGVKSMMGIQSRSVNLTLLSLMSETCFIINVMSMIFVINCL